MPITLGNTSITGLGVGGLPSGTVNSDSLASAAVTTVKLADANITAAKLDGAQSGSAPIYAARAWFNMLGSTSAEINGSANISSIAYIATGRWTVNFTTAMPDANYAIGAQGAQAAAFSASDNMTFAAKNLGTSSFDFQVTDGTGNTYQPIAGNCTAIIVR